MFHQKLCLRCDAWVGVVSWWSCQSPVAHSCSLLNHSNSCEGVFKLTAKFDEDSLLYSLSHSECEDHTVHMLTQWHLLPPLTSTVKLSLFTHAHSSPLSLAARLYWCQANCSCYINNGWAFSRETLYNRYCILGVEGNKANILGWVRKWEYHWINMEIRVKTKTKWRVNTGWQKQKQLDLSKDDENCNDIWL